MIPLPKWAEPLLLDKKCPYCNACLLSEWVCGVGIREIGVLGTKETNTQSGMSIEYMCHSCGRISQTVVHSNDPNLIIKSMDVAREIMYCLCDSFLKENPIDLNKIIDGLKEIYPQDYSEKGLSKINDNLEKQTNYNITNQEVQDFIKNMANMDHQDFMRYIGVPESEIKKYSQKPGQDNNGQNK